MRVFNTVQVSQHTTLEIEKGIGVWIFFGFCIYVLC